MTTVSVIMPCYNHGRFLAESVPSILAQTHTALELIIVNDCSTDNSAEVMQGFERKDTRVKVIEHAHNQGLSRSRNNAIAAATGEWIAFCDADDVWAPEKLEKQLELLQANPDCAVTYCEASIVNESGAPTGETFSDLFPLPAHPSGRLFETLCIRNFISVPGAMVHRIRAKENIYFDNQIELVNDWWYWIKLSKDHNFIYSNRPLAMYRVHSSSTNITKRREYNIHRFRVYKRTLKLFRNIEPSLRGEIWYHLAYCLSLLGKKNAARRCFSKAFWTGVRGGTALTNCGKAAARALIGTAENKS